MKSRPVEPSEEDEGLPRDRFQEPLRQDEGDEDRTRVSGPEGGNPTSRMPNQVGAFRRHAGELADPRAP